MEHLQFPIKKRLVFVPCSHGWVAWIWSQVVLQHLFCWSSDGETGKMCSQELGTLIHLETNETETDSPGACYCLLVGLTVALGHTAQI